MMKKVNIGIFNFSEESFPIREYLVEFNSYCKSFGIELPELQIAESNKFPLLSAMFESDEYLNHVKVNWGAIVGKLQYLSYTSKLNFTDIPSLMIFLLPNDWPISGNFDLHGGSLLNYKCDFAILGFNKNYKELFFHELFHFFGVSEGYNEETQKTIEGCEFCWMQFDPKKGNSICGMHRTELIDFIRACISK